MGTMVETDMEQFIRNHKQKVQQERNELDDRVRYPTGAKVTSPSNRKQWDRGRGGNTKLAEESRGPQQKPDAGLALGNDDVQERKKRQLQIERQKEYNELITKKGPGVNRRPRTPAHEGLPLGQYSEKRKALEKERNEEMKAAMAQKQQVLKQEYERQVAEAQRLTNEQGNTFEQQNYQNKHKQLEEERKREYQEYLAENPVPKLNLRKKEITPENMRQGLPLDQSKYDAKKQQLQTARKQEYNEILQKKQRGQRREMPEGTGATLDVGEYTDTRKQKLHDERHKEYQELQQQKLATERRRGLPPKPPTPNHFFKNLGEHDRQTQALSEERKKEYNQKLSEGTLRSRGRTGPATQYNGGSLPLGGKDSAEIRKMKARNEEYNEFLREKQQKDAHRLDHKKPQQAGRHSEPNSPRGRRGITATLPGLNYSDSAEKRKIKERNKEYNQFLKDKNRKKGWGTPTYEEILEQKRREEALRRQEVEEPAGLRSFHSEGALNRLEDNLRARELDKEFETRKVRFDDERRYSQGILEDDNWLNPDRREEQYQRLTEPPPPPREDMTAVRQPFNATLLVGHDETGSAKRRRQTDYRRELQLQMEEAQAARKREKIQELRVNATGLMDPEKNSNRMKGIGGETIVSPRREFKANEVQRYHTKFLVDDSGDSLQLNLGGGGGIERGRRRDRDLGILDTGITGLLESRRNVGAVNPPPGLLYQPSTYVTGGTGLGGPYSSIDEAYHYYGMKNPLEVPDVGGGVPGLNLGGDYGRRGSPTRVTFREPSPVTAHRKRDRSKERISPYQFPSDDDNRSRSRQDTLSYGAELERQIAEKRMQKQLERQEQERYERKLEEDIRNYNPFGRGGGGAPIKDGSGNAIADLRSLQRGNLSDRRSPVHQLPPAGSFSPRPPSPRDDKIRPPPPQHNAVGESTYARGGHGIFGQPKTDAEKDVTDKYKEELRQQIADKRRREQMEREKERAEEEKENRRLEEQRQRMQTEYDEEQRKIRAREEETRRKNEELRKQAEDKKKESERKKREVEDARMREQQEQIERERQEKQREVQDERIKSPPVPAMKSKTEEQRTNSPPLPAHRRDRESPRVASRASRTSSRAQQSPAPGPSNRPNSSDVLTQLASMRKQLQSERRRVENALENSKNEPEVFDPRTIQRPGPNKLVFENAMNKNASLPPPRAQTSDMANARNIQQFNELKFKSDSDSRRAFRSMFPEAPVTNTTLEAQQDAMLRQQEEQLKGMRDKNPFENSTSLGYGRHGNSSARSQLAANSAFIDVDGVQHFPEDFEDMPAVRNDSARARRRDRFSPRIPSVNGLGSQTSLDVDRIQLKNEERLRRLQQMTTGGDDVSMGDPDDILDRFMAKQRYNRPPSGQTLQDDTWLRPGSKAL